MSKFLFIFSLISNNFLFGNSYYEISISKGFGKTFDGIGGISGGGATSKLLVNYPQKQREQILDFLFKPKFGASLHILKVEIGGDAQSTEGTESSHMHEESDENFERGYEWWLMVEAKKRNPEIKLCGLPWTFPAWLGNFTSNPFVHPEKTADYVIKWLEGAKNLYNLQIDCIGIWNEMKYDKNYVKILRRLLNDRGFEHVLLVVGDDDWEVAKDILQDPSFSAAVDIIGAHYPGTLTTSEALLSKKPLWSSEDYSTTNNNIGAACLARILNQNYVKGFMTSTLIWNLIASYYDQLPYPRDGLMTANQPWSGHYKVNNPIWVAAHFTQFTEIGWMYLKHKKGVGLLEGGGSYVTLINQNQTQISIIIETMTHDFSQCIRPPLPPYSVRQQNASFRLEGSLKKIKSLFVWKTVFKFNQKQEEIFRKENNIKIKNGEFFVELEPNTLLTLTTSDFGKKGFFDSIPLPHPFPLPYLEDFERYQVNGEAFNFVAQSGVWEIQKSLDGSTNKVYRQVISRLPVEWCESIPYPINFGVYLNNSNLAYGFKFYIPTLKGTDGVSIATMVDRGGCDTMKARGIFFNIYVNNSWFQVFPDFAKSKSIIEGYLPKLINPGVWYSLTTVIKNDQIMFFVDGNIVTEVMVPPDLTAGFLAFGATNFGQIEFDDIFIS